MKLLTAIARGLAVVLHRTPGGHQDVSDTLEMEAQALEVDGSEREDARDDLIISMAKVISAIPLQRGDIELAGEIMEKAEALREARED